MIRAKNITAVVLFSAVCFAQEQRKDTTKPQTQASAGSEPQVLVGILVDAKCSDTNSTAGPKGQSKDPTTGLTSSTPNCPVSSSTTEFGLILADKKFLKFDEGGNAKAMEALKASRKGKKALADRSKSGGKRTELKAKVSGTLTSDTFNVASVKL